MTDTSEAKSNNLIERNEKLKTSATEITTHADNYDAFKALLQQAQRSLVIFSHNFDARLYDTKEIITLMQQLALRNKHTNIKILLQNCQQLAQNGHHVIELARRLTSKIQINQLSKEFTEHHETFIIADTKQIIFRPNAERFEGTVNYHDPLQVRNKLAFFELAWAQSEPSAEMKRLHL